MQVESKELKEHQPAFTITMQIDNLKSKGLIINDENYAQEMLRNVSYFSLIKAYSLGLKNKDGNYHAGTAFEDIVQLYKFNSKFRQAVFSQVEKIEVRLRCSLANYFSNEYGVLAYHNTEHFDLSEDQFVIFHDELLREIARNRRNPFIRNFTENYVGGDIPLYALVEIMSFGTLSKFFKNLKGPDKKAIAKEYGVGYTFLESWFESVAYVRNICAHYGRLYNIKVTKPPTLYKEYTGSGLRNTTVFAILLVIKHLMAHDPQWPRFVADLILLISEHPGVSLDYLGFPNDWETLLSR